MKHIVGSLKIKRSTNKVLSMVRDDLPINYVTDNSEQFFVVILAITQFLTKQLTML